ncbi:DUF1573 domain-containing protein [Chryseobacterium sp. cx-311]|uniref:DUF1573 domain-containing protein n=1 Tax=Marnyiella aurantia TaxID=2758037 RepID=UPI001AEB60FC|nr:DUF1573 domain-containing protein [Marnyiella aurantia]MBP0612504.1 DUF1573 domain-containing protein [Marnyiella aurantia]
MKKLFAGFAILGTVAFASAQTITFDNTVLDYGTVKPGADGNRVFTVKNTGDKPLIISSVKPSCGCTTPDFSKEPILPGKTGQIKVHYDTKNLGATQKLIEVFSNDPENQRSVIHIKVNVDPNAPEPKVLTEAELKKAEAEKNAALKKSKKMVKKTKKATA